MEFFLTNKNISAFLKPKTVKKFELHENDSNFWKFFIIWKGVAEYEKLLLFKQTKIQEKRLKLEFQEKLADGKIKKGNDAIENLYQNKTNLSTIITLASLESINILFIDKKSYYLCKNNDTPYYTIFGETEKIKDFYLEDKIQRPTINYSLRPIAMYKLSELKIIHNLTGLSLKKTKKELYEEITQYLCN
jgi:hypothetical protein